DAGERLQFLVEERAQPVEFLGRGNRLGGDLLVVGARVDLVAERLGIIEDRDVWPPRLGRLQGFGLFGVALEVIAVDAIGAVGLLAGLAFGALLLALLLAALAAVIFTLGFGFAA